MSGQRKSLSDIGGFVFPQETLNADGSTSVWIGINVRDFFAAAALNGFLSRPAGGPNTYELCVDAAYQVADAMLAAREREEKGR